MEKKMDKFELIRKAFDAVHQVNEQFYAKIQEQGQRIKELERQNADLTQRNTELERAKTALTAMGEKLFTEMENLQTQMTQNHTDVRGWIAAHSEKLGETHTTVLQNGLRVDQLTGNVGALNEKFAQHMDLLEREKNVNDAEKRIEAAEEAKAKVEKDLEKEKKGNEEETTEEI